jgi:hypothetical protein
MAKANWLLTNPSSGSGNGTVGFKSSAPNTGRNPRNTTATVSAPGVEDVPVSAPQAGKPEHVSIQSSAAVGKEGGTITVSGTSNSSKLTFSLGSGALVISLPANYTANSVSTANGAAISGDPGASSEYNFSIAIVVPGNEGITEITRQIVVSDNGGHQSTCLITLAAGDPILTVSPTTVNLDWEGNEVNVTITSNTTWSVS